MNAALEPITTTEWEGGQQAEEAQRTPPPAKDQQLAYFYLIGCKVRRIHAFATPVPDPDPRHWYCCERGSNMPSSGKVLDSVHHDATVELYP